VIGGLLLVRGKTIIGNNSMCSAFILFFSLLDLPSAHHDDLFVLLSTSFVGPDLGRSKSILDSGW